MPRKKIPQIKIKMKINVIQSAYLRNEAISGKFFCDRYNIGFLNSYLSKQIYILSITSCSDYNFFLSKIIRV